VTLPSRTEWLFSIKAFIAAMLALYIALLFDLPRPYWAMAAVYVVANPLAGATASKALYRALGTVIGGTAAVVFLPLFGNAPILFALVVSLWTGTLLYISLLDRTPRSYVFMLAGYTLPLIALPLVDTPAMVFDTAIARSEEIILGITCASLVSAIVLPASVGAVLSAKIADWTRDARQWGLEILSDKASTPDAPLMRQKLASDLSALDLMLTQIAYDAGARDVTRQARRLRGRLLMLLPVLSSLADRVYALRGLNADVRSDVEILLDDMSRWITSEPYHGTIRDTSALRRRIEDLKTVTVASLWSRLIRVSVLARLEDLLDLTEDCDALRVQIAAGRPERHWKGRSRYALPTRTIRHFDYPWLAFSAGVVVLGTFVAICMWIFTGWGSGAGFATMFAVACSFFAGIDRPAPFIKLMFVWTFTSLIGAGAYLFVVLPLVNDYWTLVLVFAGPFLFIGLMIPRPQYNIIAMLLTVNMASYVALSDRFTADFASFTNEGMAALLGVGFAMVWTLLMRPFGEELAASRLARRGWADIAAAAQGIGHDRDILMGRMLDRLGQLVPRLAKMDGHELARLDGLAEVRIGFNILDLQRERLALDPSKARNLAEVLAATATFYKARIRGGMTVEPPATLLETIDTAIVDLALTDIETAEAALNALVGIRRVLFADAPAPCEVALALPEQPMMHAAE
jgi:uncharacterized membrane protein YccC